MEHYHLAIDIGASSGRRIIGCLKDGKMHLQEIWRFENGLQTIDGHLCWNIDDLSRSVIEGLKECGRRGIHPESIGIDTWAVDFVLLDREDRRIGECVAYRDERTEKVRADLEKEGILTFEEQYQNAGSVTWQSAEGNRGGSRF